ncbi:MAG: heavy-metal-associated domain-containing protein [Nitrospirae bacterium]|nr:heavy-metal-associated domain-containing protein [Nitrospirota bacterium]
MKQITLNIEGMSCHHCVARVKKAIDALSGVLSSEVDVGRATVEVDAAKVTGERLRKAIEEAGYTVK